MASQTPDTGRVRSSTSYITFDLTKDFTAGNHDGAAGGAFAGVLACLPKNPKPDELWEFRIFWDKIVVQGELVSKEASLIQGDHPTGIFHLPRFRIGKDRTNNIEVGVRIVRHWFILHYLRNEEDDFPQPASPPRRSDIQLYPIFEEYYRWAIPGKDDLIGNALREAKLSDAYLCDYVCLSLTRNAHGKKLDSKDLVGDLE
ncbi:MAG: hypothetical protein Q9178_008066 [Gyalolechia marmorata]